MINKYKIMRIGLFIIILIVLILNLCGCSNEIAKDFGGYKKIDIAPNQKVIDIAWEKDSLWYITRPMRKGEQAEVLSMHEETSFGIVQGKIDLVEHKMVE